MRTMQAILSDLSNKVISQEQASIELSAIAPARESRVTMKVSEKGCVTFRNMPGASVKFGLSLYPETLKTLFAQREAIEAFIVENASALSFGKKAESKSAA